MRALTLAFAVLALTGCGGSHPKRKTTPPPRTDAAAMAARAHVPVLCWHQIRRATGADTAADRTYIVSPKALAEQLDALDRAGYHAVSGEALVGHVARGDAAPAQAGPARPSTTPPRASTPGRCRCCAATASWRRSSS